MKRRSFLPALAGVLLPAARRAARAAQVPRPAPELVLVKPDGTRLPLSRYRGKVVAVEFLLTTCPSCQQTSQALERLYREFGGRGFQPLGASIEPDAARTLPGFVQRFGISFPAGGVGREETGAFLQHSMMLRMTVPQLVVIDRNGVIRAQHSGGDPFFTDKEKNLRVLIEALLKEPARGGAAGGA